MFSWCVRCHKAGVPPAQELCARCWCEQMSQHVDESRACARCGSAGRIKWSDVCQACLVLGFGQHGFLSSPNPGRYDHHAWVGLVAQLKRPP